MIGWRGKIGLLVPSANTVIEPEFKAMIPEGVVLYSARMFQKKLNEETLLAMAEEAEQEVVKLADAGCDLIIYGLTAGTFMFGVDYDESLKQRLSAAAGKGVTTVASALVEDLKLRGMKKICMVTPYPQEANEREKSFLQAHGITVLEDIGMGLTQLSSIASQDPEGIYRLVKKILKPEADGILISCTNLPSIEVIEPLAQDTGKPVVTSNSGACATALRSLGVTPLY